MRRRKSHRMSHSGRREEFFPPRTNCASRTTVIVGGITGTIVSQLTRILILTVHCTCSDLLLDLESLFSRWSVSLAVHFLIVSSEIKSSLGGEGFTLFLDLTLSLMNRRHRSGKTSVREEEEIVVSNTGRKRVSPSETLSTTAVDGVIETGN
jgi:hypothetical protein